ncbi:MAG: hypothetical protein ACRC1P_10895 [Cellulosilyticaceae bacterium]
MNKVYLDELPVNKNGGIDWSKSVGFKVMAIYNSVEYILEIINYEKNNLLIKYDDRETTIKTCSFRIGNIKKIIQASKSFEDWCIENNRQDLLDRWDYELNDCTPKDISYSVGKKYYFKCHKFNPNHKSKLCLINSITNASSYTILECEICNSIGQYLMDRDGNLDAWSDKNKVDPFTVARCTHKKNWFNCLNCKEEKYISCSNYSRNGISCEYCGDGFSYPNKFMTNMCNQLNVAFETEKVFDWAVDKKYDHYIINKGFIVENHGMQHYSETGRNTERSLQEEQENDKLKRQLAFNNGIEHYIELDCRKSELEWIKNSIMNSELPKLMNFKEDDIDWVKCHEYACDSIVKEVCDLWNSGEFLTVTLLAEHLKRDRSSVRKQLKQGSICGLCKYDPKDEQLKNSKRKGIAKIKPIQILKDGKVIGEYNGANELSNVSEAMYGVKMIEGNIRAVCSGNQKSYRGFTFRYIESR